MRYQEQIEWLLAHPEEMTKQKPFTRGGSYSQYNPYDNSVSVNGRVEAILPDFKEHIIEPSQYLAEYNPAGHKVLFDENIPSITVKSKDGGFYELKYQKMAIPFQKVITKKKVQHLCGNPTEFILANPKPTQKQIENFAIFKTYWKDRNQDGMRRKAVHLQHKLGKSGWLFYFDRKGRIKSRTLSYEDGYILCSHNDENGDRLMECVYYASDSQVYIDAYTDDMIYHFEQGGENFSDNSGWRLVSQEKHGFSEIPLITKRGDVAWEDVQSIIEVYEVLYNVFMVIQKRHGWGILYVKGKFSQLAEKVAGAVILNDTSMEGTGSAEFKTPPNPQGMMDTLDKLEESIQKGAGATFILPKDIKMSGDISGVAIQLTQSADLETAEQAAIDWQNVIDKAKRLFQEGLAKELVKYGINLRAVTEFAELNICSKFKVWKPKSDVDYNSMLIQLKGAGLISEKTGIEKNTESSPDEELRRQQEKEEIAKMNAEGAAASNSPKVVDESIVTT